MIAAWLLCSFAAFRLARLIVHDTILDSARSRLELWAFGDRQRRIGQFVVDLTSCPHCIGFWFSASLATGWALGSDLRLIEWFVLVWAVAGLQSLLSTLADGISE